MKTFLKVLFFASLLVANTWYFTKKLDFRLVYGTVYSVDSTGKVILEYPDRKYQIFKNEPLFIWSEDRSSFIKDILIKDSEVCLIVNSFGEIIHADPVITLPDVKPEELVKEEK